jgi:hypothetical protein
MGIPAVLEENTVSSNAFESIASNIARNIVVTNAEIEERALSVNKN